MPDFNVFGPVVELGVPGNRDGGLVIDLQGDRCVVLWLLPDLADQSF